jgi:glyoxylase I family protein
VQCFQIKASGIKICILKKDRVALELFEFKNHKTLPKYRKDLTSDLKTLGTKHFALAIDDISRIYNKLKKSGVKLATDIRLFENGLKYFFIKDPDGILIEAIEGGNK